MKPIKEMIDIPDTDSVYCAWCGKHMSGPEVENHQLNASHGMCRYCYEDFMKKFNAKQAQKKKIINTGVTESVQNMTFDDFIADILMEKGMMQKRFLGK